jgi:ABC-type multidrug transport system permease subunit
MHPILRRVLGAVAVLGLLTLSWTGMSDAVDQLTRRNTVPQSIQVYTELIFAVLAIVVLFMAFTWRQKAWIAEVAFVTSCALSAGLASVVWGGSSILIGAASLVGAGLIASLIVWMLRVGVQGRGRVRS